MKCAIKYKGEDYSFEEYVALLDSGELDALVKSGVIDPKVLKGDIEPSVKKEEKKKKKVETEEMDVDSPKQLRTVAQAFYDSDMPEDQRKALASKTENYLKTTSFEELEKAGREIVDGLGGIENAVKEADKAGGLVPDFLKTFVYGEAMRDAGKKRAEAKTKADKKKWGNLEVDYATKLAGIAYNYGLANSYINEIYKGSNYVLARKTESAIKEHNEIFAPEAEKKAQEVADILDAKEDLSEVIGQAVDEAVAISNAERDKKIAELEKKISELGKIKSVTPKKRNYRISDSAKNEAVKAIKAMKSSGGPLVLLSSPIVNPELYKNLGTIAAYYMERGYYKFSDFYKKMKREVKDHSELYGDLYNEAKQVAIENGVDISEFTSDDAVIAEAAEFYDLENKLKDEVERLKQEKKEHGSGKIGVDKLVKEAMIDAGFGKEVSDSKGGKKTVVDWQKVTSDSKNVNETLDKLKEAIKGKVPQGAAENFFNTLERRANDIIKQKKVQAIESKVKQINRYRAKKVLSALRRRTKIENLVDVWKQGGLSNDVILDKLGDDFGFISFTNENRDWVEAKLDEIDKAQAGAEKELLEEELQAYLEDLNAPLISVKRTLETNKSRLLNGYVTFFKNLLGGADAQLASIHKALYQNVVNLKEGSTDKEILKVITQSHKKAYWTMMDILVNGAVDTGIALSETTHTKQGFPSVRYYEHQRRAWLKPVYKNILGKTYNVNPLNWEKYPSRAMAAADAFSQIMLQEVGSYSFIKNDLMKKNPNMSAKEASQKAYQIAFSVDIADAMRQAAEEFKKRGIPLTENVEGVEGQSRFNRRVHEIIEQKRERNAIEAGQLFGKRYTYKAADIGLFSAVGLPVAYMKNWGNTAAARLYKIAKETKSPTVYRAAQLTELFWGVLSDQVMPFVKSLANIAEKGFEYTTYGYYKAGAYGAIALYNKLLNKNTLNVDFERATEYSFRATIGTLLAYGILALADRDEEDKPEIYGEGSGDWRKDANLAQKNPKNTVRIQGHNIPLELFGPLTIKMRMEATEADAIRYNAQAQSAIMFASSLMDDQYFEKTGRLLKAAKNAVTKDDDESLSKLLKSESAEFITRTFLPFTSAARQAEQLRDSKQKQPISFAELLAKNSGVYFGWLNDRKAFDYRGREIDMGNVYTAGAAGMKKVFEKNNPNVDAVDEFVFKYSPSLMQIDQKDDDLVLPDANGNYAPLGTLEFTKVKAEAAKKFDKIITAFYEIPEKYKSTGVAAVDPFAKYYEKAYREMEKSMPNATPEEVAAKTTEMLSKERAEDKISRQIGELNNLAQGAAIEEYLISTSNRVPNHLKGKSQEYKMQIELYKKLKEDKK